MTPPESDRATAATIRKRPRRLWAAALMNIAIGLLSLTMLTLIIARPELREQMGTSSAGLALAVFLGSALIVSSALALFGKPWARYLMLAAAAAYYGTLVVQNLQLMSTPDLAEPFRQKLITNVGRSLLELAINAWALLSVKTRLYFERSPNPAASVHHRRDDPASESSG